MNRQPAQILHVASHHINVGDGALISAIQRRLQHIADRELHFDNFDIIDFEPEFGASQLNDLEFAKYDLVLVGGGGTIDSKRSRTQSGMAFPMSGERLRQLNTPVAFVGLGYNLFWGQPLRGADALMDVLDACKERNFPFSVRNDGSLERLREAVGSAADAVIEIPDPGFFVEVDERHIVPQFTGRRPRILIQAAADNAAQRFSIFRHDLWDRAINKLFIETGNRAVTGIARLIAWLVEEYDADIILAPHITTDVPLVARILQQLPVAINRKNTHVLGVPHTRSAAQFFAAYAQSDLVIGMRGHSVICGVGLRVPCIALSTHPKVEGFMRSCGLDAWIVDFRPGFEDRLRSVVSRTLEQPGHYFAARDNGTANFESRFDNFLRHCWELIGA